MCVSKLVRMGLAAMKVEIVQFPLAVSGLGSIGVMVVAKNLTDLIHQFKTGIRTKFWLWLVFHNLLLKSQ